VATVFFFPGFGRHGRMVKINALIRRLPAVETLAR